MGLMRVETLECIRGGFLQLVTYRGYLKKPISSFGEENLRILSEVSCIVLLLAG